MPVTQIGLVYYSDDPHKRVFRRIYPTSSDAELDGPPTDGHGNTIMNGAVPHTWTDFGVDLTRPVAIDKVGVTAVPPRLSGTPSTPATEAVWYYLNVSLLVTGNAIQTQANLTALATFVGQPNVSNVFGLTGATAAAALATATFPPVSPSQIVVVGGDNPGVGTQQKTTTIGGQAVALWVV